MDAMGQTVTALDCRTDAEAMVLALLGVSGETKPSNFDSQRRSILTRAVERDVIPTLLRAHGLSGRSERRVRPALVITPAHVIHLADLTLGPAGPASDYVKQVQADGVRAESLYLDLLAPAAVRLGDLWTEDLCDFAEVTIGLVQLQNIMRQLGPAFFDAKRAELSALPVPPRAYLVPLPGEQHTFGLAMLFDFFHRAGWNVWSGTIATRAELGTMVRSEWVDMVGFSLACDERLETARQEIRAVRLASRNPGLSVMVGGPCFVSNPELAAAIGADGTARDGLHAVGAASALVKREAERR